MRASYFAAFTPETYTHDSSLGHKRELPTTCQLAYTSKTHTTQHCCRKGALETLRR
jgi:hypothetical protein